ncbi:hypothetical protein [uncultured Campylobacter sp.]|uniref:hypothetical protein n=1 Tax=uncultured Campylobacter sp. TaxID=218934 RepID=UPI0026026230|nr:hypothetical protein [uncultured Campylobacter sp.]
MILARSLNLGRAWVLAKIKFHARPRYFVKDTAAKTRPPFSYVAQALSRIGAILDKIKQR